MQVRLCRVIGGAVECCTCVLPEGGTVRDALASAGWVVDLSAPTPAIGVFGVRVDADHVLQEGDRVECYHALPHDPKERRRRRARRTPAT